MQLQSDYSMNYLTSPDFTPTLAVTKETTGMERVKNTDMGVKINWETTEN